MISSIECSTIWRGRTGTQPTYFQPRATAFVDDPRHLLMTLQTIGGSDCYGDPLFTESTDAGETWSDPLPVPSFERAIQCSGVARAVCDVVPVYHKYSNSTICLGSETYYKDGRFFHEMEQPDVTKQFGIDKRATVYSILDRNGIWSDSRRLDIPELDGFFQYCSGCSQSIVLPGGDLLIPLYVAKAPGVARNVCTVRMALDGVELKLKSISNFLSLPVARGLLEPSVCRFAEKYFLTIRAEDGCAYVACSNDGLNWRNMIPWKFSDGRILETSTTQQHWLQHKNRLYLIYTRKAELNRDVFRYRAPLWMAEVDPERCVLLEQTETIVFPLERWEHDGGTHIPQLGNFHITALTDNESLVTVGDVVAPYFKGDTCIARLT